MFQIFLNLLFWFRKVLLIMKKLCIGFFYFAFISLPIFLFSLFFNYKHFKKHFHFNTQNLSLTLFGSASMQQLCDDLGDEFSLLFPSVCFSTGGNGSSEAVFAVNSIKLVEQSQSGFSWVIFVNVIYALFVKMNTNIFQNMLLKILVRKIMIK